MILFILQGAGYLIFLSSVGQDVSLHIWPWQDRVPYLINGINGLEELTLECHGNKMITSHNYKNNNYWYRRVHILNRNDNNQLFFNMMDFICSLIPANWYIVSCISKYRILSTLSETHMASYRLYSDH